MRDEALAQRNFLRTLVDRSQYPQVENWLWIERQAIMQDPTPLKQARADEGTDQVELIELKQSVRKYVDLQIEAAACVQIGFTAGMLSRIDKQEAIFEQWAEMLGIDMQAQLDAVATRIQEGG